MPSKTDTRVHKAVSGVRKRLREVRGERSQRAFAGELGINQQNVNRYEQGVAPRIEFLVRLSVAEGVDLHWLLTGRKR